MNEREINQRLSYLELDCIPGELVPGFEHLKEMGQKAEVDAQVIVDSTTPLLQVAYLKSIVLRAIEEIESWKKEDGKLRAQIRTLRNRDKARGKAIKILEKQRREWRKTAMKAEIELAAIQDELDELKDSQNDV